MTTVTVSTQDTFFDPSEASQTVCRLLNFSSQIQVSKLLLRLPSSPQETLIIYKLGTKKGFTSHCPNITVFRCVRKLMQTYATTNMIHVARFLLLLLLPICVPIEMASCLQDITHWDKESSRNPISDHNKK